MKRIIQSSIEAVLFVLLFGVMAAPFVIAQSTTYHIQTPGTQVLGAHTINSAP